MIFNRNFFSLCAFFILFFSHSVISAAESSRKLLKFAVVDMERIFSEYSYINQASEDIEIKEIALKKLLITANQELDKLTAELDSKDNKAELDFNKKKQEIQASVDKAFLELEEKKKNYNLTMNTRMAMTLDKFAKSEKYDLILNRACTLEEGADITDSFLKQLEALK
ncbi:MAG: OmpH family outer membrane protein [bacterium]